MISYYELLEMVKKGDIPDEVRVHLIGEARTYMAVYDSVSEEFSYYSLDGKADEDYKDYLMECFIESCIFDKNIEIIVKKPKIEKLNMSRFTRNQKAIARKVNEIIDQLNKEEE
jgi:hypothetical protein